MLPKPCAGEDVSHQSLVSRSHSTVSPQIRSALAPGADPRKRSALLGGAACGCPSLKRLRLQGVG